MEKRALGKGLAALIPEKSFFFDGAKEEKQKSITTEAITHIKTALIQKNTYQPRINYDEEKLIDLKASIKEKGVLQPLLVRETENGYEVVAGERRLRAARSLGLEEVPVVVKQVSNQEALVIALIENIQREELNPMEEAKAFRRLMDEFALSQEEVAKSVGKDRSTVSNILRLLKLPDEIQSSVSSGVISMGHARALLGAEKLKEQKKIFKKIVKKGLSVREVEKLVRMALEGTSQKIKKREEKRSYDYIFLEEDLQQILGTKVRIQANQKRGKLIIEYYSPDELERVIQIIKR
ncbi:MAG: ParB/RepB/Spo0J family partition protein [Candidatus Omnitrophica bacterium]|nr:ParB/RepB/Spo0J family partition protein [Candidatus Omnitrophota bacterium]